MKKFKIFMFLIVIAVVTTYTMKYAQQQEDFRMINRYYGEGFAEKLDPDFVNGYYITALLKDTHRLIIEGREVATNAQNILASISPDLDPGWDWKEEIALEEEIEAGISDIEVMHEEGRELKNQIKRGY